MKRKTLIRGHKSTEMQRERAAQKSVESDAKRRMNELRKAIEASPTDVFGLIRKLADAQIVAAKKRLQAAGLAASRVLVVLPDPKADPGDAPLAFRVVDLAREDVRGSISGKNQMPLRTSLLRDPHEGNVWVLLRAASVVLLLEEATDTSVASVTPSADPVT